MNEFSRRRFLQSVLAVGAGTLFSSRPARAGLSEPRVLLVGNGVGGQMFAATLNRLAPAVQITVVDPVHVRTGQNRAVCLSDVVTELDFHHKIARTASGMSIGYDALVLSPGADVRWGAIEGYTQAAVKAMPHDWVGKHAGVGLRAHLGSLRGGATVIVYVPRGVIRFPAGVDSRIRSISGFLARHNPRAKLVVLDARPSVRGGDVANSNVEWLHLSAEDDIVAVEPASHTLYSASDSFRGDLVNLIPPQRAGEIACRHGLVNEDGWCPVDGTTAQSHVETDVYVLGDASAQDNTTKSGLTASRQALQCAQHLDRLYSSTSHTDSGQQQVG